MRTTFKMQQLGILSYVGGEATRTVFRGTLKDRPEDFVVTELDSDGNPVSFNSDVILEPRVEQPVNKHKASIEDVYNEESLVSYTAQSMHGEDNCPPLESLVSRDVYHLIEKLANYCDYPPADLPTTVSLGCIEDKSQRKNLHTALRKAFPQLCSTTEQLTSGVKEIHISLDKNYHRLKALLGHEDTCRLLEYLNVDQSRSSFLVLGTDTSKQHRTEVHHALGELYGHMVITHTRNSSPAIKKARHQGESSGQDQCILVQFRNRKRRAKQQVDENEVFTKFVLRKENVETLEAVNVLSQALHCHNSQLAYAGSKDTRAITTQCMTVRGITPSQLAGVGPLPNISIGNFQCVNRHIHLGEHGGNHFMICIRDFSPLIPLEPKVVLESAVRKHVESLEKDGFVNYFGPQRFGYSNLFPKRVLSHQIGLAMLQENHVKAVDLLLRPDGSSDAVQEAKEYFTATKDVIGTLKLMPENMTRERLVLKALKCHGYSDYGCTRALCSLPYNSRLLYLHSYSSLLWNHLASFRINEYGFQPVEGDLVLKEDHNPGSTLRDAVYMLTTLDISSGKYSMRDIVLPTPGTATILPGNKTAERLTSLLSDVGLSLKSFRLRRLKLSSSGSYRHLLQYPKAIKWKLVKIKQREMETKSGVKHDIEPKDTERTNDGCNIGGGNERVCQMKEVEQFQKEGFQECIGHNEGVTSLTHMEQSCSEKCKVIESGSNVKGADDEEDKDSGSNGDSSHKLELEFSLPPSTYATILLRQLMRTDL